VQPAIVPFPSELRHEFFIMRKNNGARQQRILSR
jgi:hypothetical protein